MSAADIDACEELFCGTWTLSQFNDVDEFMNASGMYRICINKPRTEIKDSELPTTSGTNRFLQKNQN